MQTNRRTLVTRGFRAHTSAAQAGTCWTGVHVIAKGEAHTVVHANKGASCQVSVVQLTEQAQSSPGLASSTCATAMRFKYIAKWPEGTHIQLPLCRTYTYACLLLFPPVRVPLTCWVQEVLLEPCHNSCIPVVTTQVCIATCSQQHRNLL